MKYFVTWPDELYHHGIKGQEWGVRRFQYKDGSVTPAGARRYYVNPSLLGKGSGATVQNAGPNSKASGGSSSDAAKAPEETKEEPKEEVKTEEKKDYDVDAIATAVIRGDWGNGQERIDRLREAGYNPDEIQSKVNEMMSGSYTPSASSYSSGGSGGSQGSSGYSGASSQSSSNNSSNSRNYKPRYELNPRTASEAEAFVNRIIYNQQHGQPQTAREAEERYRKLYGRR